MSELHEHHSYPENDATPPAKVFTTSPTIPSSSSAAATSLPLSSSPSSPSSRPLSSSFPFSPSFPSTEEDAEPLRPRPTLLLHGRNKSEEALYLENLRAWAKEKELVRPGDGTLIAGMGWVGDVGMREEGKEREQREVGKEGGVGKEGRDLGGEERRRGAKRRLLARLRSFGQRRRVGEGEVKVEAKTGEEVDGLAKVHTVAADGLNE